MASFTFLLFVYIFGGLTFLPLVLYLTVLVISSPPIPPNEQKERPFGVRTRSDSTFDKSDVQDGSEDEEAVGSHPVVAAASFVITREYDPEVMARKGDVAVAKESNSGAASPSLYQSMYSGIFDRNKSKGDLLDNDGSGKRENGSKTATCYAVLRLRHLTFYESAEQLEVRQIITLDNYNVDIYAGGEPVPEGELYIKRNCIRLRRKPEKEEPFQTSPPILLFTSNCSEKEDFYHALVMNQRPGGDQSAVEVKPLNYQVDHMAKLVQLLHKSGGNVQTRWINALIGRIFLSIYQTPEIKAAIRAKIMKKVSRVQKPSFLKTIDVLNVSLGDSPPLLTNTRLKELTIDGDLTVEADISYYGNFRIEIAAIAQIDLGPRFKVREVNLMLAGILKKLEGHIYFRVKPPPSNRIWFSFSSTPKIDLDIAPIVSTRQITYGPILRAMQKRIIDVISETLVLPNWDDLPFFDTLPQDVRGGIWARPLSQGTPIMPLPADELSEFSAEGAKITLAGASTGDLNSTLTAVPEFTPSPLHSVQSSFSLQEPPTTQRNLASSPRAATDIADSHLRRDSTSTLSTSPSNTSSRLARLDETATKASAEARRASAAAKTWGINWLNKRQNGGAAPPPAAASSSSAASSRTNTSSTLGSAQASPPRRSTESLASFVGRASVESNRSRSRDKGGEAAVPEETRRIAEGAASSAWQGDSDAGAARRRKMIVPPFHGEGAEDEDERLGVLGGREAARSVPAGHTAAKREKEGAGVEGLGVVLPEEQEEKLGTSPSRGAVKPKTKPAPPLPPRAGGPEDPTAE